MGEKVETFTLSQYRGNPHLTLRISGSCPKVYQDIKEFHLPYNRLLSDDIFIFIRGQFEFESVFVKEGRRDIHEKMNELKSKRPSCLVYGHTYPQIPTIPFYHLEKMYSQLFISRECCVLYDSNLVELFDIPITNITAVNHPFIRLKS